MPATQPYMGEGGEIAAEQPPSAETHPGQSWRTAKIAFISFLSVSALLCVWGAFEEPEYRLIVLFTWPIALWLLIAVHELGHAVVTWAVGWRVVAIAMGPLGYHFHNR